MPHKNAFLSSALFLVLSLFFCLVNSANLPLAHAGQRAQVSKGQKLYVPVYSHIYHGVKSRAIQLSTTLSIRNTDEVHPIILTRASYYNTEGKRIRDHVKEPVLIPPLGTHEIIVQLRDTKGGSGANFIVEWHSDKGVNVPVVEAVMIGTESSLGISFARPAQVLGDPDR
ncbi:DUF3124 domain-containing protein [Desulfobaculum bizertense]|uniref:DUF3124 domain-containing protein n=1 Tax=Desulfobaculum bizertense DSM 18034 TaxID=1121442 RepID=A0A1T4WIV3_9BACT|nr:DUF3124 domain-containing protein [Desulfobaculum bizertense]SKA76581.1 Protein of unknown function [Desulfobaculum bizertense DSM 18034]